MGIGGWEIGIGDWEMWIGDWEMCIGDWDMMIGDQEMNVLRIAVYCIQNTLLEKFDFSLKIEVPLARSIRDRDWGLGIGDWDSR